MNAHVRDTEYEAIDEQIKAAVKAGLLTKEEAEAKWAAIKKASARKHDVKGKQDAHYKAVGETIDAAVKAG